MYVLFLIIENFYHVSKRDFSELKNSWKENPWNFFIEVTFLSQHVFGNLIANSIHMEFN